ncbi:MAG: hypothetical protein QM504_00805 [Pseudomonadota bacterium]
MNALIPQLFILTVEASIVLLIVVLILLFFIRKSKKNDLNAVKQLVNDIKENESLRLKSLASILKKNKYKSNPDEKAKDLHNQEKIFIQELLNVYLKRDIFRLDNIPGSLIDLTENFLKLASAQTSDQDAVEPNVTENNTVEQGTTDNSKILQEATAIKEKHLKELSELRLKNTELNEHLFESLETITGLVTEHSKSQGGDDKPSAQQVLDAIIYLRDQRSEQDMVTEPESPKKPPVTEQADETLFAESTPDLGLTDILNTDLESDLSDEESLNAANSQTEDDPWADALAEQSDAEKEAESTDADASNTAVENDPWADALAEQSDAEKQTESADEDTSNTSAEDDPWADALAEQSDAEKQTESADEDTSTSSAEGDPWADALAEQSDAEKQAKSADEDTSTPSTEDDPWADALAEQSDAEKQAESADEDTSTPSTEDDPWADALAEQSEAEKQSSSEEQSDDDLWAEALSEQADSKKTDS